MNLDLESFLATMTIPPPPHTNGRPEEKQANVLTSEEISSFIIPPPPPKAAVIENQLKSVAKDYQSKKMLTSVSAATTPDGPSATNEKTLPGFSCCSRPRQRSPDTQPPCLPTRAQNMTLPRVKPKVPPRIDSTLSTKPPLPPMPSQVRRATRCSFVNVYTNNLI